MCGTLSIRGGTSAICRRPMCLTRATGSAINSPLSYIVTRYWSVRDSSSQSASNARACSIGITMPVLITASSACQPRHQPDIYRSLPMSVGAEAGRQCFTDRRYDRAIVWFDVTTALLRNTNRPKRLLKRLTVRACGTRLLGFYTFLNKCFVTKCVKRNIRNLFLLSASGSSRRVFEHTIWNTQYTYIDLCKDIGR